MLLPRQITRTSLGILKYSTVLASANELGGIIQTSVFFVTKLFFENFLGSTNAESIFVNTLNSFETLAS